jgi:hypothetical protein
VLERSDEGEPERLARLGDLSRIALRHDAPVGHRLDPRDLRERAEVNRLRLARRAEIHRPSSALASLEHVEADVRRDAVEP